MRETEEKEGKKDGTLAGYSAISRRKKKRQSISYLEVKYSRSEKILLEVFRFCDKEKRREGVFSYQSTGVENGKGGNAATPT